ncbi:MAG: hypothetical protein K2X98_06060 [Alphaproteobacteria bacterium]|nr:hypothetical protein [Alphaproteobacteria bacterium]MBX9977788.1 hypothetical protein [Alphaproteobacteria bacterium]
MVFRKITQIIVFAVLILCVSASNGTTDLWASRTDSLEEQDDTPPRRKKNNEIQVEISDRSVIPPSSIGVPTLVLAQGGGGVLPDDSNSEVDDRTPKREVRIHMGNSQQNSGDDIDLQEDVSGCEDNYYRCCLCCFRITRGWVDLGIALTLVGGAVCTGITTYATLDSNTATIIGTVTTVGLIVGAGLKAFKTYLIEATATRTEDLRTVIRESHRHAEAQERRRRSSQILDV